MAVSAGRVRYRGSTQQGCGAEELLRFVCDQSAVKRPFEHAAPQDDVHTLQLFGLVRDALQTTIQAIIPLARFKIPLEPESKQRHFLLTSSPPSCFFHIPGGPAGAVEVFAPRGVKASWDLLLLEGGLELQEYSEDGVIYRLHEAKARKL